MSHDDEMRELIESIISNAKSSDMETAALGARMGVMMGSFYMSMRSCGVDEQAALLGSVEFIRATVANFGSK